MKKIFILLLALMLGGCGSSSDLKVDVSGVDSLHAGEELPVELRITKGNEGAAGLDVKGTFEMKSMDHDTLEVSFHDEGNGKYTGKALFPMSGDWQGYITLSDAGKEEEVLLSFKVKE